MDRKDQDDTPVHDLHATLSTLMARDIGHDPEIPLHAALKAATTPEAVLALAGLAVDFGARDSAEAACARLAGMAGMAGAHRDLAARIATLWNIADLPAAPAAPATAVPGRIAYVLYSSLPWLSTGYALRSQALALALRQAGADVHCITRPGFPWDEPPEALLQPAPPPGIHSDHVDDIPYHRIARPLFDNWPAYDTYVMEATAALIDRLRALKPAMVMAASSHTCALPALRAARALGLPMVYDMRGIWELSRAAREPSFLGSPQFYHERSLETAVARQADHVFTLSQPMRVDMIRRGVRPERITFLPNGCDPLRFGPKGRGAALRRRLQVPLGVAVIGYAGSFPAYEGLEDLIAATARIKARGHDFRLVLLGDQNGTGHHGLSQQQILNDLAARLGVADRLIMIGRVANDAIPDFMDAFDMVVIPRRSLPVTETVAPLKPIEAMAAGKAVIISSVAGMAGLIRDGETGLVFEAGNITALADRIEDLLKAPARRDRLADAARHVARKRFSWTAIARDMVDTLAMRALLRT